MSGHRDDRRVVTVPVWMMRLTGGNAQYAVVLSQIAYWTQPNLAGERRTSRMVERRGETWMYLTDAEMGNELGMGDDQFRRARLALGRQGLIATRSSQVDGRKVTLVRLTISPIPDGDDAADARRSNPADARDPLPIEPREKPENLEPAPNGARADLLVKAWWEERKAAGNPPAQPFIACRKVVEAVLRNGVSESRVEWALRHVPVVSSGAIEMAIQREIDRRGGPTASPRLSRQDEALARAREFAGLGPRGDVIDVESSEVLALSMNGTEGADL